MKEWLMDFWNDLGDEEELAHREWLTWHPLANTN